MCRECGIAHPDDFWCAERTISQYKLLAYSIVNQFVRTYKIPNSDIPDFEQHLLTALLRAPQSYRNNSSGVYTVLKNNAIKFVQKFKKHDVPTEAHLKDSPVVRDKTDYEGIFHERHDQERIVELLASLPGPERTCMELFFGIGVERALPVYMIAKKLGTYEQWVERKLARGKLLLKRRIGGGSLTGERAHARTSSRHASSVTSTSRRTSVISRTSSSESQSHLWRGPGQTTGRATQTG